MQEAKIFKSKRAMNIYATRHLLIFQMVDEKGDEISAIGYPFDAAREFLESGMKLLNDQEIENIKESGALA